MPATDTLNKRLRRLEAAHTARLNRQVDAFTIAELREMISDVLRDAEAEHGAPDNLDPHSLATRCQRLWMLGDARFGWWAKVEAARQQRR
jgi:hypothetical protein